MRSIKEQEALQSKCYPGIFTLISAVVPQSHPKGSVALSMTLQRLLCSRYSAATTILGTIYHLHGHVLNVCRTNDHICLPWPAKIQTMPRTGLFLILATQNNDATLLLRNVSININRRKSARWWLKHEHKPNFNSPAIMVLSASRILMP